MNNTLQSIVNLLSESKEFADLTYIAKNYTKADLIKDLKVLLPKHFPPSYDMKSKVASAFGIIDRKKRKNKPSSKIRKNRIKKIIKRDGLKCFYCGNYMRYEEITIEHLHAKSNGGGNSISNLRIAHFECNSVAGNLDVSEKLRLRGKINKTDAFEKKIKDDEFALNYSDYTESGEVGK